MKKKLIEVALPLEAINRESAREKSIRHGHPSTLHLWWARRPLAACRAVLFAQLVDDPSAHPELFPTEADQETERKRLFNLIERLVVWENTTDQALLDEAHAEIVKSCDGNPPPILDPFAGGGSIPLEAQRLGLEAHASDLNPVAVLINKALIEIPPKWAGRPPVFPGAAGERLDWPGATGLAEDVRRYGQWMRDEAEKSIGHLYPKATLPDGTQANVIAWIWARTVTCPNPACRAEMPLISTYWLSSKKDRPYFLEPVVEEAAVQFQVSTGESGPKDAPKRGRGAKFACECCGDVAADAYIKAEAMAGRMGHRMLSIVAEGDRQRVYLNASPDHLLAAQVGRPQDVPQGEMPKNPRWFSPPAFGMTEFSDLFTDRQLVALTTFSGLVAEARTQVCTDSRAAGLATEPASEYGDAVALYLAFMVSNVADDCSSLVSWRSSHGTGATRSTFARQALPMVWDYAESNPFGGASGDITTTVDAVAKAITRNAGTTPGFVLQADATLGPSTLDAAVSTDPPYYDNIGYADLSDFFYVWLRRSLGDRYPGETSTLLTPKSDELVATPYRFGGSKAKAEAHFEAGFIRTFTRIRENHSVGIPLTIYYAFKQSETDSSGTASTGWETMLKGLFEAGLMVTATWPMRTERGGRMVGIGNNVLASSVVLACRPRPEAAEAINRRQLIRALHAELPLALKRLQQGSIAPVDMAQAAIGPGMAVFSRYSRVVEADGSDMTVHTALALINQVLDEVLAEQEGDFDSDTRFAVKWFSQFGWNEAPFGEADNLSRSTNTSVDRLVRGGIFRAVAGKARLLAPGELSSGWDPLTDEVVSDWEVVVRLGHALATEGSGEAARLMAAAGSRVDLDTVKELAYLLFALCEKRGWAESALLFNGLGTSWSDVAAAAPSQAQPELQLGFEM